MQRAAKQLACGSTQNRCTDWFSAAREMLRGALHDRSLLYRYFGTSLIISNYHLTNRCPPAGENYGRPGEWHAGESAGNR